MKLYLIFVLFVLMPIGKWYLHCVQSVFTVDCTESYWIVSSGYLTIAVLN